MSELPRHPDEELSAYLDGTLEPEERSRVEEHLAGCPTCRNQLEQLAVVREVMRTLPFVEPPLGFYERTLRLGPRPSSTGNQRFGRLVTAGILGLIGLLVILAVVRHQADEVRPRLADAAEDFGRARPASRAVAPPAGLPAELPMGLRYAGEQTIEGRRYAVYVSDGQPPVLIRWTDGVEPGAPRDVEGVATVVELADGGWYAVVGEVDVVALPKGDRLYMVIGPNGDPRVAAAAGALPAVEREPTAGDRVVAAGRALLEAFGFGG